MSDSSIYSFTPIDIKGKRFSLKDLKGKHILFVNVASKCSFTPQYEMLEALYQEYKSKGLMVIAFPCNQFMWQEPGDSSEIEKFCTLNYNVTFPVMKKVDVNGPNTDPLWTYLKDNAPGWLGLTRVWWNFEKFLVSPDGKVLARFRSAATDRLREDVKRSLEGKL